MIWLSSRSSLFSQTLLISLILVLSASTFMVLWLHRSEGQSSIFWSSTALPNSFKETSISSELAVDSLFFSNFIKFSRISLMLAEVIRRGSSSAPSISILSLWLLFYVNNWFFRFRWDYPNAKLFDPGVWFLGDSLSFPRLEPLFKKPPEWLEDLRLPIWLLLFAWEKRLCWLRTMFVPPPDAACRKAWRFVEGELFGSEVVMRYEELFAIGIWLYWYWFCFPDALGAPPYELLNPGCSRVVPGGCWLFVSAPRALSRLLTAPLFPRFPKFCLAASLLAAVAFVKFCW